MALAKMHKIFASLLKKVKRTEKVIHIEKCWILRKKHLYTKLYTLSTCGKPFFLVEKSRKKKHLFCNIFPKVK